MSHSQSVYMRTLARAAEVSGGFEALAAYLDVPPTYLHAWMSGARETPTDVFLKVVDFLMYEHFALADKRSARRDDEAYAPEPRAGGAPHRQGFR